MKPDWLHPGVKCICVEDEWTHVGDVLVDRFPVLDGEYTAAGSHDVDGVTYLILADEGIDPGFYQADAFRAADPLATNIVMFPGLVKDASASPLSERVPA